MKKIPSLSRIKTQIKLIRVIDFLVIVGAIIASIWLWWYEPEPETEFWSRVIENNVWRYAALLLIVFIFLPCYSLLTYILKYNIKAGRDVYHGNKMEWRLINLGPISFFIPRNISFNELIENLWEKIPLIKSR